MVKVASACSSRGCVGTRVPPTASRPPAAASAAPVFERRLIPKRANALPPAIAPQRVQAELPLRRREYSREFKFIICPPFEGYEFGCEVKHTSFVGIEVLGKTKCVTKETYLL